MPDAISQNEVGSPKLASEISPEDSLVVSPSLGVGERGNRERALSTSQAAQDKQDASVCEK